MDFIIESIKHRIPPVDGIKPAGVDLFGDQAYKISINNLNELLELAKIARKGIIIQNDFSSPYVPGIPWKIVIYDGYYE